MTKSYAPQVIADSTGKFVGNGLRFATKEEAERQVSDLALRWTSVRETRVVESDDPVNYQYIDGKLTSYPWDPKHFIDDPRPEPEPDENEDEPQLICSICDLPIPVEHGTWTRGHNAQPVNNGRCCGDCNAQVVLPMRIARILASGKR
jgi:hypothetical protein